MTKRIFLYAILAVLGCMQALAQNEFDPQPPGNPGANYWYSEKGEVVVDDFTPGSLEGALNAVLGDADKGDVLSIVVAGIMNRRDFYYIQSIFYKNCTLADLSRCTGVNEVPAEAFYESKVETVYLPATIEKIGRSAFSKSNLKAMSIYALTPPELDDNVFYKAAEDLIVYVPAAAIPLYSEAEGWKDFTILPIQEDIRNLTVVLPEGSNGKDYAQLWLELENTKNGQRLHYVMTDRTQYTFPNIIRNTQWQVTLRNERGDVFGQIDEVNVYDEDVTVAFASLIQPQTVALRVTTPDGQDVTPQVQATWTDAAGNYIAQGTLLTGLPTGMTVVASMTLPQELVMSYATPHAEECVLGSGTTLPVSLQPIAQTELTGRVKDAQTGLPIEGAAVSASQTFGGRYTRTVSTTTAADGTYELAVACVPTTLGYSATDYVSQSVPCSELTEESAQTVMSDVGLRPITGATITLGYTYTPCSEGDEEPVTQNWYADYQNVDYTLTNVTQGKPIDKFHVQYPQIVLMEEVADGDVLRLTATSRTGSFMPVEVETTIANQQAKATIAVSELGKVQATITRTGNAAVTGMLYDGADRLVATADYADAHLTFEGLTDGTYTLVSMGKSQLFNTIGELSQLSQTRIAEGTDYVAEQVRVISGRVTQVSIDEVPTLDESKLYYTGSGTSFTANKSDIALGNYVMLTGRIDFKTDYAERVSQIQLVTDLPEGCQFVENSVMVGNNTSAYTLNGRRLTVPLDHYFERVRFCVVPTVSGNYSPNAFVQFDLDGATITQPIGTTTFQASFNLSVPAMTAKPTFAVSGTSIGASTVDIYDGDVLIGRTTAQANGAWATTCELNQPANLSRHQIVAKATTTTGLELTSEAVECMYDRDAIEVKKVMMYHNNPETGSNNAMTFDFQNPSDKDETYTYYIYNKQFTFTIDFTDNDTTLVSDVVLYVETANGDHYPLDATYDEKQGLWVATGEFGNMYDGNELPVNVSVDYALNTEVRIDPSRIRKYITDTTELDELKDYSQRVDAYFSQLNADTTSDDLTTFGALIDELMTPEMQAEEQAFLDSIANLSDAEIDALLEKAINEWPEDMEFTYSHCSNDFSKYHQFTAGDYNYLYRSCEGLTLADVPEDSHVIPTIYGDTIYVYNSANRICYIDFTADIWCEISHTPAAARKRAISEEDLENILNWEGILADEGILKEVHRLEKVKADRTWIQLKKDFDLFRKTKNVATKAAMARKLSAKADYLSGLMRNTKLAAKVAKIGKAAPVIDFLLNGYHAYQKIQEVEGIFKDQSLCKDKKWQRLLEQYKKDGGNLKLEAIGYHSANFAANTGLGAVVSALAVACPMSLFLTVPALFVTNLLVDDWYDGRFERQKTKVKRKYEEAMRKCLEYDKKKKKKSTKPGKYRSGNRNKRFAIDPSGYVYEAVPSNRLEGVTATIYYKEMVEDMYGDLTENIVKWNAAEYGQENPLFTDANGCYRWDVPQGLWQVVFEKQGYETTRSEWLPVPPPQLDVNIAMRQSVQPVVTNARAYEDAVVVTFDKYMQTDLLTADNIRVSVGDTPVEGTVLLMDAESEAGDTLASRVRFQATQPFSAREVTLTVSNRVRSYAGIRMQDDYSQTFTVEQELRQLLCDSVVAVDYGQTATMAVTVLPASASAGKVLRVRNSAPVIVGTDSESIVLDAQGSAQIVLNGSLPGTSSLHFTIDGSDLAATATVNVVERLFRTTATPTASIASGVTVDKGTQISLSCDTEGATIYYTLDGSCPCEDSPARKVYDGTPFVVNENTAIQAMAVADGMDESDVATFNYFVDTTAIEATTKHTANEARYNLHGQRVGKHYKGVVITNSKRFVKK